MGVAFTVNYFFNGRWRSVDSEVLLMTDFVNLKIKLAQSFKDAHRGRMCIHMFISMSAHTCMNICVYTVFLKKWFWLLLSCDICYWESEILYAILVVVCCWTITFVAESLLPDTFYETSICISWHSFALGHCVACLSFLANVWLWCDDSEILWFSSHILCVPTPFFAMVLGVSFF
jgi:hypothetical protein